MGHHKVSFVEKLLESLLLESTEYATTFYRPGNVCPLRPGSQVCPIGQCAQVCPSVSYRPVFPSVSYRTVCH